MDPVSPNDRLAVDHGVGLGDELHFTCRKPSG